MFTSYLMSNPCRMNVRSFKTLPHIAMGLNASQLHRILPSGMFDAFSTTTSACPPRLSKHRRLYMSHDMEGWSCRLWIFNDILLHFACITFNALGKLHSYTVTPICCRHGAEKSLQTSCTRISHDMSVNMIHDPTPGCKAGHPSSHPIGTSIGPRTTRLLDSQDLNRTWATRIEAHAWIILEHLWMSSESSVRFEDDNIPPPPSVCTNQKLKLPLRWGICLCYSKSVNGKQPPTHYSTWMAASYSCAHATHVLQLGWISEEDIGYTARARKSTIALQTSLHSGLRLGFFTAPDSRRE